MIEVTINESYLQRIEMIMSPGGVFAAEILLPFYCKYVTTDPTDAALRPEYWLIKQRYTLENA